MIKDILLNPWNSAIIVFVTQILIFYLRTLNIIYTVERRIWPAILTNSGVNFFGLISMAVGVTSLLSGEWQSIVTLFIGGGLGTYFGMRTEYKSNKK